MLTALGGHSSIWTRTYFERKKEGNGVLRNTNDQGTISCPFFPNINIHVNTPLYSQPLNDENDDREGMGKIGQLIVPFLFSSSLFNSKLKIERFGRTYEYEEVT